MVSDQLTTKRISLDGMPNQVMLVLAHPSGVTYLNQVGGHVCWQAQLEGVLCPLEMRTDVQEGIRACSFPNGAQGVSEQIADRIDELLGAMPETRGIRVDRARLGICWEAWIYVVFYSMSAERADRNLGDPPEAALSFLPFEGFAPGTGVLTWPNSD